MTSENLLYIYLLSCGTAITISCVIDNHKLYGYQDAPSFNEIELPQINKKKNFNFDLSRFKDLKEYEKIKIFCDVITKRNRSDNLIIFYNNINELKIKRKNFNAKNFIDGTSTKGQYSALNFINIDEDYNKTIYHELTHMSSTYINNGVVYCGFSQKKNKFHFGEGLNEGYTQLETERNFKEYDVLKSYGILVHYSKLLELIIGEELMKNLYYNANLYGLIDELKHYSSIDEIMNFIKNMDYIKKTLYEKKFSILNRKIYIKTIIRVFNEINYFLSKSYLIKISRANLDETITDDEFKELSINYINKLIYGFDIYHTHYDIYNDANSLFDNTMDEVIDQMNYELVLK